jgi:hypothetical protein
MPNSSFLPEDYLERKAQQRTNIFSLVMFVLVMGAVIAAFLVTNRQRTAVKALQAQVNSRFETAAKRLEQLDELQQRKEQMVQKARVTSSLLEADLETKVVQKQARALTSLEKARDEKKAKAAKKANPLPEVKETAVTMSLIGVAPTDVQVAQFMAALSRSPLFADLNLAYSQEERVGDETMRRFRVEMGINQAIDLQKLQPAMVRRPGSRDPMGKTIVIDTAGKLSKPAPALPVSDPGAKPAAPR